MADMTREDITDILEEIALLLELKGENPFKIRAYRNGADAITSYGDDFLQKARDNELSDIKGFGKALAEKIHQLVAEGEMDYHQSLKKEFPDTIFELFTITGVGPKKIKALYNELEVASIADLKRVCESGEASSLSGFGKKTCAKILEAIAFRGAHADRFLLGDVMPAVRAVLEDLRAHPAVDQVEAAGSVRRGKETAHDLDFIVSTKKPSDVMSFFVNRDAVQSVIIHGGTKSSVYLDRGLQCDLRAVSSAEFPFALNYFTGSKEHNVAIRGRARDRGYTLNEYRLAPIEGREAAKLNSIHTEQDLYRALDLDYVEPALRENAGEVDAAEEGELPRLIELENLRGTFHNHTTESDGKNTLEEMAAAAEDLGLEYLGISDHSKSSFQANGLDADRLLKQVDAIRAYNNANDGITLFAGTECDILRDGTLDFEDEVLAQLDYVVASVHNVFTLSEKDQTARILKAVENPYVTMLGHLTGRLLLRREPYALDIDKIIDACAETGTWIEINANPRRLDMDWRRWHQARDKGVKAVINPDAHNTEGLQHLYFGVQVARKGWLRKEDVMNCLTTKRVIEALKVKSS
ncbi:MAG: DNA polymerase/3'-5' exonuclease PolX [Verrucomicrobiaceae bacterium]|nr:DNA polymerase/3'-5' exonuclease PolX [Verrucomicrobiaceae bacterium]